MSASSSLLTCHISTVFMRNVNFTAHLQSANVSDYGLSLKLPGTKSLENKAERILKVL